jgi:hypothetical protein
MSATTEKTADAQTQTNTDDSTEPSFATYTFKTTEENRDNHVSVSLSEGMKNFVKTEVVEGLCNHRWRSFSQFLNDAIIHYLNGDVNSVGSSAGEVLETAEWSSENKISATVTDTLFDQIDILVSQIHTPWSTKQDFYICALFNYIEAEFPPVIDRR